MLLFSFSQNFLNKIKGGGIKRIFNLKFKIFKRARQRRVFVSWTSLGFTLIELMVVIAIIAIISSLSLVIINGARSKGRDAKRVSDIRQIAVALDLCFANEGSYPTVLTPGQSLVGTTTGQTYMVKIPNNATPTNDGSCASGSEYSYTSINSGQSYFLAYCLGNQVSNTSSGTNCATVGNVAAIPGSLGIYPGNTGANPQPECSPCICGDCSALNCDGLSDYATSTATCLVGSVTYKAIKVGNQCWMDKNINLGTTITGATNMNDDTTITKWCYNNTESICTSDGALYTWAEMMYLPNACNSSVTGSCAPSAYVTGSSSTAKRQGICPKGWHVPSDYEFWILENYIDSSVASDAPNYYTDQIGNDGTTGYRGINIGTKLKPNGVSHLNFILAGRRNYDGSFDLNTRAILWLSVMESTFGNASTRWLDTGSARSYRSPAGYTRYSYGFSVRCLKD